MSELELRVNGKNLNDLKVGELKKELKGKGLSTTGNNIDLLARLED